MMNIKEVEGKQYVFCAWRKKYVRLTPEEHVRQQILHQLVTDYHYPEALIAVEVMLPNGRRADAVVYDTQLQAQMLIEFKAPSVALTQKVLDQIACYNRQMQVPYLMLSNGPEIIVARIDDNKIDFLNHIPLLESGKLKVES